ncbi:MAG: hypothetical protein ACXVA3_04775 [Vulcanimicrobiaceae bacterium]
MPAVANIKPIGAVIPASVGRDRQGQQTNGERAEQENRSGHEDASAKDTLDRTQQQHGVERCRTVQEQRYRAQADQPEEEQTLSPDRRHQPRREKNRRIVGRVEARIHEPSSIVAAERPSRYGNASLTIPLAEPESAAQRLTIEGGDS